MQTLTCDRCHTVLGYDVRGPPQVGCPCGRILQVPMSNIGCPQCRRVLKLAPGVTAAQCPFCGCMFAVPGAAPPPAVPIAMAPPPGVYNPYPPQQHLPGGHPMPAYPQQQQYPPQQHHQQAPPPVQYQQVAPAPAPAPAAHHHAAPAPHPQPAGHPAFPTPHQSVGPSPYPAPTQQHSPYGTAAYTATPAAQNTTRSAPADATTREVLPAPLLVDGGEAEGVALVVEDTPDVNRLESQFDSASRDRDAELAKKKRQV